MGFSAEKPVLFWDFHGTLTRPDVNWFDAAQEAAAEVAPRWPLTMEVLKKHLSATCLPWFTNPDGDTRHLSGSARWWAHSQAGFVQMFVNCGLPRGEAEAAAPLLREKILQPHRYTLYPDAAATLRELGSRGYQSHILSNNFPELEQVVEALGLRPLFGQVLVSGLVGYEKPRREIFDHARDSAGHPGAVWMIGDNPVDDILGARRAGFDAAVAVHGAQSGHATASVDALAELPALLP